MKSSELRNKTKAKRAALVARIPKGKQTVSQGPFDAGFKSIETVGAR